MIFSRFSFDRKARAPASFYPKPIFHAIRLAQLVSSMIVFSIMTYFIYYLNRDGYYVPWTFIWTVAASLGSFLVLAFTMALHCCTGLHPHLNIVFNGSLCVLWGLSWALLTYYMGHTLRNWCDADNWHEDLGVMICRIYKALFSFVLIGFVSTIAAFVLDIYVLRQRRQKGLYQLQNLDNKPRGLPTNNTAYEPTHGAYSDSQTHASGYGDGGLHAEPRVSETWEADARLSFGPYGESRDTGRMMGGHAYEHPEEQFEYDSSYHGGHRPTESTASLR